MTTMREQRIVSILSELSIRIAEYNTTLSDLRDDFNHGRRASMQIRKSAQKCIKNSATTRDRFINIASANNLDKDVALYSIFRRRVFMNNELTEFFT